MLTAVARAGNRDDGDKVNLCHKNHSNHCNHCHYGQIYIYIYNIRKLK